MIKLARPMVTEKLSLGNYSYLTHLGLCIGMTDLGPKWLRLCPNGTYPELFQIRVQYILAVKKVPDLSHFGQSDPLPVLISADDGRK